MKGQLSPLTRIIVFVIGMGISVSLLLYGFHYAEYPIAVTLAGINLTDLFLAVMIILVGLFGGTLIKSGILGKWKLD